MSIDNEIIKKTMNFLKDRDDQFENYWKELNKSNDGVLDFSKILNTYQKIINPKKEDTHEFSKKEGSGLFGGIKESTYLSRARTQAKKEGYDPKKLSISDKKGKKLMYDHEGKKIYFGASGYGDFLIWKKREKDKEVPKGTAEKKRKNYRARAKKIYEKSNKYSPSALAFNILW